MAKIFEKNEDEYGKFDRIINPSTKRDDLYAFLLLDKLVPQKNSILEETDGHEVKLNVNMKELQKIITEEDIITLLRCGIHYDSSENYLYTFVS